MKLEDFTKTEIIAAIRSAGSWDSQLETKLLGVAAQMKIDAAETEWKAAVEETKELDRKKFEMRKELREKYGSGNLNLYTAEEVDEFLALVTDADNAEKRQENLWRGIERLHKLAMSGFEI